jgi:uncharacterized phage protein (TIGR01671 family)
MKIVIREIKFRGFNRKNNVWLYGFYLQNRGAHFIVPDEFADGKSWDDYEIDPATLGQYTGLKDRNGREIYEGDILHDHFCNNRYVVLFDGGSFDVMSTLDKSGNYLSDVVGDIEIIGNIHDNPELMK